MFAWVPLPAKFGSGKKLSIAWPKVVIREDGMILPGNCTPVVGSMIGNRVPLLLRVWEKLPWRSSAVGVYLVWLPPPTNWPVYSWEKKKNNFFLSVLKCLGIKTGPPKV